MSQIQPVPLVFRGGASDPGNLPSMSSLNYRRSAPYPARHNSGPSMKRQGKQYVVFFYEANIHSAMSDTGMEP
jgi:hypothetical protein